MPQIRTFAYQSDDPNSATIVNGDTEITGLMAACTELARAWREDHSVVSVRVLCAIGNVIRETNALVETETPCDAPV